MNTADQDDHERNKETQAFDPLLTSAEKIERLAPEAEQEENSENKESTELKEEQEKTQVGIKDAMLRATSGLL
jgi:hypothetical protein